MSWKAWYFAFGFLAMAAGMTAIYCAAKVGPWAVGMLAAVVWFKMFDGIQTICWDAYLDERRKQPTPQKQPSQEQS